MSYDASVPHFVCHGCGARVAIDAVLPFACPNAAAGDDVDHLLVPEDVAVFSSGGEDDPFLRYRALLSPYRLARAAGLSDDAWADLVGALDRRLIAVDGRGFRVTPMTREDALAEAIGLAGPLRVKNETGNVSGSHKARHLMGVMLYLRVLDAARLPVGDGLRVRRLAIASCGNAALAAAVVARAAEWPLDVFIPPDASAAVVARLKDLGAAVTVCDRRPGETGDPCVTAFRAAVRAGALPFGVQGPDNGLAVEGARTLGFEIAETLASEGGDPGTLFVQVGGGALASALAQGLGLAVAAGRLSRVPRLVAVQTAGCAPLARAQGKAAGTDLAAAAQHRTRYMWAWETTPHSLAHGILDDETYDWLEILKGVRASGGDVVVADEPAVARAWDLGRRHTTIAASATGTAGLAGLLAGPLPGGPVTVLFSGVDR
ncbi:pyridoxal-phosphate dependent enzyme [Rhodoplanes sp. TEM]|uniref:pyridoxal-phosphate dependent enzyme n=1 Tax=Rhodoplanes TaxID=29407 RepID=UPI0023508E70|nr:MULTISPECIES: pyridoxal-phosphate dependent enzyme [Rhodoplanes]MDC7987657.1 pyridoxal-phosphate dependent enzyme [Rhodoplanes sp. TEM]MDQ0358051.1 threonine synthase [Rhodoplanes tepidamans]